MTQFLQSTLKNPVKWGLALAGVLCLGLGETFAQSGYNYQSRQSGDWSDYTTWQRWSTTDVNKTIYPLGPTDAVPSSTADRITILQGHSVVVDTYRTVDELVVEAGATLEVALDKKLTINNGPGTDFKINGTLRSKGGSTNAFANFVHSTGSITDFSATGVYQHNPDVKIGVVPVATWDPASTVEFIYSGNSIGGTVAAANNFNQNFGNVKWNTPAMNNNIMLGGQLSNIQGNFEVISTGTAPLILSTNGTHTLNVGKDLVISGTSDLVFSTQSAPTSGSLNLNIGKNLTVATNAILRNNTVASPLKVTFKGSGSINTPTLFNMNFEVAPASVMTLTNSFVVPGVQPSVSGSVASNFKVFGTLNTGLNTVSGNGNFSLENGGTLGIGLAAGISSTGGNIITATKTFSPLANYVYDRQNNVQNTGNLLPATVAGLTINNPLGVTLTAPVTVTNNLRLTKGLLNTGSNTLNLTEGIAISSGENSSYVNGPVSYQISSNGNHNITFPTGAASQYRPVALSFNQSNSTPTIYTASLVNTQPVTRTIPEEMTHVSSLRHYNITKSNGSAITNGYVTFSFASDDMVTDPNYLGIAKSDGSNWKYLGGSVSGNTVQTTIPFDTFSDFVLANAKNGNNPLPVELLSFKAEKANNAVNLKWETASEKNNDFFAIERSVDGHNFESLGQVKGAGNSSSINVYSFADKNPVNGTAYYRLKQVDFDGKFEFSKIVNVSFEGKMAPVMISAYPNPAFKVLNVNVTGLQGKATLEVTDVTGRNVNTVQINPAETPALNVENLPNGLYQIRVVSEQGTTVSKFVKQ